jgi:hypothetical protein
MRKIVLILLVASFTTSIKAQKEDSAFIKRISDEIMTNGKAYDNLYQLTKNIGGRLAGSPGMVKAEKWGLNKMQESGADKAWMQECMVPHWLRGGKDEATAKGPQIKKNKALDVLALGNSMGSGKNGVTADILLVNSFDELETKKDQVKGKIVFFNYKFIPTFVNTF